MKEQRNIAVCVILSFITCGIYMIYWFVKMTDEANLLSIENQTASGGMAFVFALISCGFYTYYWMYKQGEKIDEVKRYRGIQSSSTGIIYVVLTVFGLGIVAYALMQNELNKLA